MRGQCQWTAHACAQQGALHSPGLSLQEGALGHWGQALPLPLPLPGWLACGVSAWLVSGADQSPTPAEHLGSNLLTRQLHDFWRRSRSSLAPQRLLFEVTSASVVSERSSKYVVSDTGRGGQAGILEGVTGYRLPNPVGAGCPPLLPPTHATHEKCLGPKTLGSVLSPLDGEGGQGDRGGWS